MQKTRIIGIAVLIVGGGVALHVARAQQPGIKRTDRATVPSGCHLAARAPGSQTSAWRILCNPACTQEMRAAVVRQKGGPFELETLQLAGPRASEVRVRIVATGICATDIHAREEHLPMPLPAVLGHEGAGVVERVGSAVTTLKPGDHVVLSQQSCGHCPQCLRGHPAYCAHVVQLNFAGARLDGTNTMRRPAGAQDGEEPRGYCFGQSSFATYALATERNAATVPDDVPLELLGPLGCGLSTGAGAVLNAFKVGAGSRLAVFGIGPVGMATVMAGRAAGAGTIIGVDVVPSRLSLAAELGRPT